jgi:hypothetical protein
MKSLCSDAMPLAVYCLLAGCGHPPAAKHATPELPAQTAADLAGSWTASDESDYAYALAIAADGTLDLVVDRNKLGRCEAKGTFVPAGPAKRFTLTYRINECERGAVGASAAMVVESRTADELVIAIGSERHAYRRAVSDAASSTPRP